MVKHKRWSDKPKPNTIQNENINEVKTENTTTKQSTDIKSIILSGTKYIYIVIIASLFSGIFTPLTLGVEIEIVISGILTLILGLVGGILIFLGTKNEKYRIMMILAGLALLVTSLVLINEIVAFSMS
tara:strand:+ start:285 stop:668 length:384 start_codon:yes stop_codon:yes gene_type:complete